MNRTQRIAALEAVYARVPLIDCKGLCHDSCGPIAMTALERDRLRLAGHDQHTTARGDCSLLTPLGRCAAYELRPAICRAWALTPVMPCPFGCVPEGGMWPDVEVRRFLADVAAVAD